MNIALFGFGISEDYYSDIEAIIHTLVHDTPHTISIYGSFAEKLHKKGFKTYGIAEYTEVAAESFDFVFSLGGDGTFLKCAHLFYKIEVPLVGINFGKLGFLADVMPEQIHTYLEKLEKKQYTICTRTMLDYYSEFDTTIHGMALNEITVQKSNNLKLIRLKISLNGSPVYSFWADGIIISTPTGSTGYALSLGGPIITPDSNTLAIVPIAPHSLTMRPLIVPDNSVIEIEAHGEFTDFFISGDYKSQQVKILPKLIIKKSMFNVFTVQFDDTSFFEILQNKLQLGLDVRK
ncbi:MAG: NAD(+)/NADH kinase [Bacteroidales bacterium]|jgi:NAD+ kinase|nr:NAD(+)/NADH kinase [Bacteroidales bacterium]